MKKQISYRDLQRFDQMATSYFIRNEFWSPDTKQFNEKKSTKLVANLKNVVKQGSKLFEEYAGKIDDINIDNCVVDEKTKAILKEADNQTYKFSKDGQKARNKALKELQEEMVDIHIRITEGEFSLTDEEKEAFSGLVIPEEIKKEEDEDKDK